MPPPDTHSAYLRLREVTKRFGAFAALEKVSLEAARGEFISILGPSGCGKTTLLRVIAGLEPQTEGQVEIQGRDVSHLPVSARNVGIVFQSYALFPNLTARAQHRLRPEEPRHGQNPHPPPGRRTAQPGGPARHGAQVSSPALRLASSSVWPWPGPWPCHPTCCFWMNPFRPWTPRCASCCAAKSANSSSASG